jgi:hypothetical protein
MNTFSLGAQIGGYEGSETYHFARAQEQQLRNFFNDWRGDYSKDTKEFAFLLRIDANIRKYTEMWKIVGSQPAKLKKGHVEVEIGIPETWWRQSGSNSYRQLLADEIEKGFSSMIDLLRRRRREIKAEQLLSDWAEIKRQYVRSNESSLVQ